MLDGSPRMQETTLALVTGLLVLPAAEPLAQHEEARSKAAFFLPPRQTFFFFFFFRPQPAPGGGRNTDQCPLGMDVKPEGSYCKRCA